MTDDLISRQAAIDALKNRWKKTRNYEGIGDDIAEECELYLKQLPSAQPEPLTDKEQRIFLAAMGREERRMTKYIELIDKYEIRQSDSDEYNPPSYIWTDNTGEVIRCKDCKHRKLRSREKVWTCLFSDFIFPEHYCSYAERKEE